jgi:hypothetical protein
MRFDIWHEYQPDLKSQFPAAVMWFFSASTILSAGRILQVVWRYLSGHSATLVSPRIPPTIGDHGDAVCYVIDTADSIDPAALVQITERDDTGAG